MVNSAMNNVVTANDLKTKGVQALEVSIDEHDAAIISVRGEHKFFVLPIEQYEQYREAQLEMAIEESKADLKAGRYFTENVKAHMKRVTK